MSTNVVNILKTLGDDTRLRIVYLIDQCGPNLCVCDMVAVLEMPQSTISRQLMRLRHMGIVEDSRDGMWINYSMNQAASPIAVSIIKAIQQACDNEPVFLKDKNRFNKLHAENKIVRCKRGSNLEKPGLRP